ncbi:MAG: cyclic-di-AMP receptor [Ruminococcus sp.]|nr:cyclic-di-AMP receptor [Ruminococcus sp.]
MKLIFAVINNDDNYTVSKELLKHGFRATKLASTGGFLSAGNTTFLICCCDEDVDRVVDICKENSRRRRRYVPNGIMPERGAGENYPVEVNVGGATIFVTDIERFEQV